MAEAEAFTDDFIYGGRIKVRQPARGYRVNVDTILLGASLCHGGPGAIASGGRAIELGCGVGAAVLIASENHKKTATTHFFGIEREPLHARLAEENVAANGLADRVTIIAGDALSPPENIGQFDAVFFNPPYDREDEGRAPAETRRAAHVADSALDDWIKVWSNRMRSGAHLTLIQRAARLDEILAALEGRLGGALVFPIRARAGENAKRIIVRAFKGSRAPLKLLAGLDLHPSGAGEAKYTPQAEAILSGNEGLSLS